jgi:hypothetical protein
MQAFLLRWGEHSSSSSNKFIATWSYHIEFKNDIFLQFFTIVNKLVNIATIQRLDLYIRFFILLSGKNVYKTT